MIFDAFCISPDIMPGHVKTAYKFQHPAIIIFSDEAELDHDIRFSDGHLEINGHQFNYLFMNSLTNEDLSPCEVISHQVSSTLWKAQTLAFKATYQNFIDTDEVLKELDGLPFKNDKAKIDFFINEIVFSPDSGMIPLGLALMDSALQSTVTLCKARKTIQRIDIKS